MSKKDSLILIETFNLKVISNWNAWFISEPSVTFNHCIHPPVSWPRQSQYESIFPKLWGKILYIYIYIYNISNALFGSWDKTPQKNVRQPLAQLTADKQKKTFIFYVYLISFYVSFLKLLASIWLFTKHASCLRSPYPVRWKPLYFRKKSRCLISLKNIIFSDLPANAIFRFVSLPVKTTQIKTKTLSILMSF